MTEDKIQKDIVKYLRAVLPKNVLVYHCPNGGKRSARAGDQFKNMGVLPGVPDLCFVLANGMAAFIEVKQPDGTLSLAQEKFKYEVTGNGCPHGVARSVDDVETLLKSWGVIK